MFLPHGLNDCVLGDDVCPGASPGPLLQVFLIGVKIKKEQKNDVNHSNMVLHWGCQDLQKKDLVRAVRTSTGRYIRSFEKDALAKTASLKKPRSASKQKSFDDKLKAQIQSMEKVVDICEQTILAQCNYTLIGENAMGKILTILRDNGSIDYKIDYPLFLFDNEIK